MLKNMPAESKLVVLTTAAAVALAWAANPSIAAAGTKDLDNNANFFVIGEIFIPFNNNRPAICWCSGGSCTLEYLTSGAQSLQENWTINALGGADNGYITTASHDPGSGQNCGHQVWGPIDYNGFFLDVTGGDGNDVLQGPDGSDDTRLSGNNGDDILYNYTTIGWSIGGAGNDELVNDTTGSSNRLMGDGDGDCLWSVSATFAVCDCGTTGTGTDYRHQDHSCSNCDATTDCCGIC